MSTTYTKIAHEGDVSKFARTSEPQIPEHKTYYYSNSDYDVIKYDQCCVEGGKSDSSICGPFPSFLISVTPIQIRITSGQLKHDLNKSCNVTLYF